MIVVLILALKTTEISLLVAIPMLVGRYLIENENFQQRFFVTADEIQSPFSWWLCGTITVLGMLAVCIAVGAFCYGNFVLASWLLAIIGGK